MSASALPDAPPDPERSKRAQPIGQSNLTRVPRVIVALILREMSSTYGRKPGGYVWAILEPLTTIVILAVVFSIFLRAPSLGTNFVLFYASGVLTIRVYQQIAAKLMASIPYNKPLLTYPRVTMIDSMIARTVLSFLTQIMVSAIVMVGIFATQRINEHMNFSPILAGLGLCVLLAVGVGSLNAFLVVRFPVWLTVWGIVTRPLALLSGLFYIYEDLPTLAQKIIWFNPLIHVTGMVRAGVYSTYDPSYVSVPYVLAWGIIPLIFGLLLILRHGRNLLTL